MTCFPVSSAVYCAATVTLEGVALKPLPVLYIGEGNEEVVIFPQTVEPR